jgi:TolB-like protein
MPTQAPSTAAPDWIHSVAILPLQDTSPNSAHDALATEMTDKLTSALGQISEWKVIDSQSAAQYRSTTKSKMQIARELHVEGLMEGSIQGINNRIHLTLQLTDGSGDHEMWAMTYDRDSADLQELANEIARDIAQLQLSRPSRD